MLGAAAGPFAVMNLIKPRINLHAIRNLAPLGPFYAPARADDRGRRGRSAVRDRRRRRRLRPAGSAQIADRLLLGCFLPVLQALDEDVAEPAEFDLGAREALKFGVGPAR